MTKNFQILTIFLFIAFCTSGIPQKGWWNDYEGTIGKEKIMLSIFCATDNSLKGSYYYLKYGKKIEITGFIEGDSLFLIESLKNQLTGKFTGIFTPVNSENTKGMWTHPPKNKQLPFSLQLVSAMPGRSVKRYSLPLPDDQIEEFAASISKKVKTGDKVGVAVRIHYPVEVFIDDKKVIIDNQTEFVNLYDKIFQSQMVQKISNCQQYYLFEKDQAIMMADGEIWFGQPENEKELKILIKN